MLKEFSFEVKKLLYKVGLLDTPPVPVKSPETLRKEKEEEELRKEKERKEEERKNQHIKDLKRTKEKNLSILKEKEDLLEEKESILKKKKIF